MNEAKYAAAAAMFEGDDDIWMITGGYDGNSLDSTESFNVDDNSFSYGLNLPKEVHYHNLVNVNNTHMVLLGGDDFSDEIFIMDR